MNLQQMMMQAQKIKREMDKAQAELAKQAFVISKNGAVTVTLRGDYTVSSVAIDEDMLEKDNQDMLQELLVLAINEGLAQITEAKNAINDRLQG